MLSRKLILDKLTKLHQVNITENLIEVNGIKLIPYLDYNLLNKNINIERLYNLTLHLAWEILGLEIYGLSLLKGKNIVLDVGMNIGVASAYFASLDSVIKVYGYEPVFENYNHAVLNMAINSLGHKAKLRNYGLSGKDMESVIPYSINDNQRGSAIASHWEDYKTRNPDYNMINIKLKSAEAEIQNIIESNNDCRIWVKMDCQGSEYDIINSLSENSYSKIDGFLGEFHELGVGEIKLKLNKMGYVVHYKRDYNARTGFFIAIKQ